MRLRSVVSWVGLGLVLLGWAVFLRPAAFGGSTTFVGVSGVSMTPTMHDGDLAVVRARSSYDVGDIIAFRIPAGQPGAGNNIIHRIVGGDARHGFLTRGDYNKGNDLWRPTQGDVLGEVVVHIPDAAGWMGQLRRPGVLAIVVGLLTFVIVIRSPRHQNGDPAEDGADTLPSPPVPAPPVAAALGTGSNVRVGVAVTAAAVAVGLLHGARHASGRGRTLPSRYSDDRSRL